MNKEIWKMVTLLLYDHKNNIMLHQRPHVGNIKFAWGILGGSILQDETPHEAIIREIKEEVVFDLHDERFNLEYLQKLKCKDKSRMYTIYSYKAKFPGFNYFTDTEEVKVSDLSLFTLDEALKLDLLPICRVVLANYKERMNK